MAGPAAAPGGTFLLKTFGNGPDWPPRRRGGDPDDPLAQLGEAWKRLRARFAPDGGMHIGPWPFVAVALFLYLLSGIYTVAPDQRGVVLRFGRAVREAGPGPHYHLPWPVERVLKPRVTRIMKAEIGFRTIDVGPPARYRDVSAEALMLTGDENIVKLDFIVQYRVKPGENGPTDYLFNVRNPHETVRAAAEAAMREVMGRTNIDDALTEGKERVQEEAQRLLQKILDSYGAGIEVVTLKLQDVEPPDPVSDAFKDVISAQQDRERMINEARGYRNDVVPKARGRAAELVNQAEAYRAVKVREAEGAAQRFLAVYREYAKAKEVTRRRLYIEAMEAILPRVKKIILDREAGEHVVPYLPLEAVGGGRQPAPEGPAKGAARGGGG